MKIANHERLLRYRKHLSKIKGKEDEEEEVSDKKSLVEMLKSKTPPPIRCLKTSSPTFTISTSARFTNNIFEKFNSSIH